MRRKVWTLTRFAAVFFLLAGGPASAQEKVAPPAKDGSGAPESVPLLAKGSVAPAFRLSEVSGESFSYGGQAGGKPLLLAFFSVFCDPCRAELAALQRIQEKYGNRLEVAAVSLDGEVLQGTVAGFAKQEGYAFRVLLDEVADRRVFRVADAYRVTEMPTLYLVDGAGRIIYAGTGRVAVETLEKAVRAALAG